ncbi:hypothetical protein HHI36_019598 [Cryptolaemus montrouzieri]|uniref:Uncharacterized protein n=1 Tax=Cryptolaemus montrouzieri TaxID=559131 RepID=A0ABD2N7P5_9CUCU
MASIFLAYIIHKLKEGRRLKNHDYVRLETAFDTFLCLLVLVKSQSYEYNTDEGDTESDIEGDSRPDYSKYYSVTPKDGGLTLAGFTQPEFGFGFGPYEAAFGASSQDKQKLIPTQAFVPVQVKPVEETNGGFPAFFSANLFAGNQPPQDYFEQSQSRQKEEKREQPSEEESEENEEQSEEDESKSEYNRPGPNYISHEIPAKIPHQVETVKIAENQRANTFNYVNHNPKEVKSQDYKDHYKPSLNYNFLNPSQLNPPTQQPLLYPQAPGYQRLTHTQTQPKLTPYEKYSFQPVDDYQNKYLENLNEASSFNPNYEPKTSSNYQPEQSKVVPRSADKKNCKKIRKQSGNENAPYLTCFVCENAETSSKVTECSYQSEPDNTDLHKGSSERYSVPARKPTGFRFRRYASEEESDPYEYVKNRSLRAEKEKQEGEDDYSYEGYEASQPEKSFSEIQSEEILKDPKKCTDVERDGMSCRVCKDPATGGNYESCSFSRAPKPEKYAYVSEKNYDSNDDPEYASEGDESKNVPTNAKANSSHIDEEPSKDKKLYQKEKNQRKKYYRNKEHKNSKGSEPEYPDYKHPRISEHERIHNENDKTKGEQYQPYSSYPKYEAESKQESKVLRNEKKSSDVKNESSDDVSPYKDIDEYQFKYFPEFSGEESRVKEEPLNYEASSRKEVEDVLADFQKRDRSQCKQTKKNGMTCFLCVDENKIKNEECMFISESRPKGTIAKYTKEDVITSPSEIKQKVTHKDKLTKKAFGTSKPKKETIEASASSEVETIVRAPSKRKHKKASKASELKASASAVDSQRIEEKDDDPKIETPSEFKTPDEGGAYSAETRPVYSKALGLATTGTLTDAEIIDIVNQDINEDNVDENDFDHTDPADFEPLISNKEARAAINTLRSFIERCDDIEDRVFSSLFELEK